MRNLLLASVALTFLLTGCASSQTSLAARDALMAELASRLERIRRAHQERQSEPVDAPYAGSLSALIGIHQIDLYEGLGPPTYVASCPSEDVLCPWTYSMYYLPYNYAGGGQELVIRFDDEGIVTEVESFGTQ